MNLHKKIEAAQEEISELEAERKFFETRLEAIRLKKVVPLMSRVSLLRSKLEFYKEQLRQA